MIRFRTETQFHKWFRDKVCVPHRAFVQKLQVIGLRGWPDLTVVHDGMVVFYEVKVIRTTPEAALKTLEPIQRFTLNRLVAAGANAYALLVRDPGHIRLWHPRVGLQTDWKIASVPLLWLAPTAPEEEWPRCPA